MKSKKLRIFAGALSLIIAFGCLTACGSNSETDTSTVTTDEYVNDITLSPDVDGTGKIEIPDITEGKIHGDDKTFAEQHNKPSSNTPFKPQEPTTAPQRASVRITIPEGYTMLQIARKLEQNGVCTVKEFMDTAQTYPFKATYCTFLNQIPARSARCYKLEGFMFPDTYDFYKDSAPEDAVAILIRGFQSVAMNSLGIGSGAKGYSMYDVLTIASIVEKEVQTNTDKNKVAGVLYNRLKKGMMLQMDSTRDYVNNNITDYQGKFADTSKGYDTYASGYNTYKCKGLPAGPICNPGRSSIRAALNPVASDYLYFCTTKDGKKVYYAKTLEEHNKNLKTAGLR